MTSILGLAILLTANVLLVSSFYFDNSASDAHRIGISLPGTKWCGLSKPTDNETELGVFEITDACCRDHHECEEVIEPFSSFNSLENPSILPKFSCNCDQEFLTCLKDAGDRPSIAVGKAYFGIMGQCFAEDYPVLECVEEVEGILGNRCVKYKFDETKEKQWQFFDLPYFNV